MMASQCLLVAVMAGKTAEWRVDSKVVTTPTESMLERQCLLVAVMAEKRRSST